MLDSINLCVKLHTPLLGNKKPHFAWRVWVKKGYERSDATATITHSLHSIWCSFVGEIREALNGIKAVINLENHSKPSCHSMLSLLTTQNCLTWNISPITFIHSFPSYKVRLWLFNSTEIHRTFSPCISLSIYGN